MRLRAARTKGGAPAARCAMLGPMSPRRTDRAVAEAAPLETAKAATGARGSGSQDPLVGELRRAGLLPLLVLHFLREGPSYGGRLMERVGEVSGGLIAVNPNTMYPLLRELEAQGARGGRVGAPRAPLAALLPPDRGRRGRAPAAGRPSSARAWTPSPPASTSSAASCGCSADGPRRGQHRRRRPRQRGRGAVVRHHPLADLRRRPAPHRAPGGRLAAGRGARAVGLDARRARPRAGARDDATSRARARRSTSRTRRSAAPSACASRRPRTGVHGHARAANTRSRSSAPGWPLVDLLFIRRPQRESLAAHAAALPHRGGS